MSFILLVVAGCGGGTTSSKPLPLGERVMERGEFQGYTLGARRSSDTPRAYLAADSGLTPSQREVWIARLTREGFKTDLTEFLNDAQGPQTGLSGAMQLGSAASARAELTAESGFWQGQNSATFPVKAIPGAVGYGSISSAQGGQDILFADGPFLYLVGYGWYGTAHNPKQSALIEAATKLYTRVHGHPPS